MLIVLAIIALSGFFMKLEKENRFSLLISFVLVVLETILASMMFTTLLLGITTLGLQKYIFFGDNYLFALVLLVAVIVGFILYFINMWLFKKLKISNTAQTLSEYIIQWGLIYATVYQVIFDNVFDKDISIESLDIAHPTEMNITILPALIAVWIGIIMYKLKNKQI